MINLVVDNTKLSAEDKAFEDEMDHFYNLKDKLGYDTTWSMGSGVMALDQKIFSDKIRVVTYKCIAEIGDTMDDVTWMTFTAVAMNGTVGELWKAAENCFQQAKAALGDWHYFVEDFDVQEDGTLELVTGS